MPNQKGYSLALILVVIVLVIVVIGIAFYLGRQATSKPQYQNQVNKSDPQTTQPSEKDDKWSVFTNEQFNFTFQHPSNWKVETQEGFKNLTTTIVSPSTLQITFITGKPHGGSGDCYKIPSDMDLGYEKITVFNESLNLFYFGDKTKNKIAYAYIIKGAAPCNNNAFFEIPDQVNDPKDGLYTREGSINIGYTDNLARTAEVFKGTDLETAKKIIESFNVLNTKN